MGLCSSCDIDTYDDSHWSTCHQRCCNDPCCNGCNGSSHKYGYPPNYQPFYTTPSVTSFLASPPPYNPNQ